MEDKLIGKLKEQGMGGMGAREEARDKIKKALSEEVKRVIYNALSQIESDSRLKDLFRTEGIMIDVKPGSVWRLTLE